MRAQHPRPPRRPPPHVSPTAAPDVPRPIMTWKRGAGLAVWFLLVLPFVLNFGFAGVLLFILFAAISLLVFGTIGWAISRRRRSERRWAEVLFSRAAIISAALLGPVLVRLIRIVF